MIIPPGAFHLLVLSQHVKAEPLHLADVKDHSVIGRGRQQAFRPVALVENAAEKTGFSVEGKTGIPVLIRALSEITHGKVSINPVFSRRDGHVIEGRRYGRPKPECPDGKGFYKNRLPCGIHGKLCGGADIVPPFQQELCLAVRRKRLIQPQFHLNSLPVFLRHHPEAGDIGFGYIFQPDGLPDAALALVIHPAGMKGLLAAAGRSLIGIVPDIDPQGVLIRAHAFRHIKGKCQISVPVLTQAFAVPPDDAALIHRAEVEQHPAAHGHIQASHFLLIPERLPGLKYSSDTGQFTFRGIWHHNLSLRTGVLFLRLSEGIVPESVQVLPGSPHKLGSRVLRKGNTPSFFAPYRAKRHADSLFFLSQLQRLHCIQNSHTICFLLY